MRDDDIVVFAYRDAAMAQKLGSRDVRATGMTVMDLNEVRKTGAERAVAEAVVRLAAGDRKGFWIHLDVDVLDDAIMPAVDYRMTDGLDYDELITVLRTAVGSGRAVGLNITIFNPNLDPSRTVARALVAALAQGLAVRDENSQASQTVVS